MHILLEDNKIIGRKAIYKLFTVNWVRINGGLNEGN